MTSLKFLSSILIFLPKFKGKIRLGKFLIFRKLNQEKITIRIKNNLLITLPNLTETLALHLFVNGEYEPYEINFINSYIKQNGSKTFIDIGANIGVFSLDVAKKNPNINVYAVEASPRVFDYLSQNIIQNKLYNIHSTQIALGDQKSQNVNFYSDEMSFGTGSLSPVFTHKSEIINCTTLDRYVKKNNIEIVDLIKIDVEGYENQVFIGAKNILNNKKSPVILFEFVDWAEELAGNKIGEAQKTLLDFGYRLYILKKKELIEIKNCIQRGSATIIAIKN